MSGGIFKEVRFKQTESEGLEQSRSQGHLELPKKAEATWADKGMDLIPSLTLVTEACLDSQGQVSDYPAVTFLQPFSGFLTGTLYFMHKISFLEIKEPQIPRVPK